MADKLSLNYGFVTVKENEELTEGLNIIEKLVTFFMFVAYYKRRVYVKGKNFEYFILCEKHQNVISARLNDVLRWLSQHLI